MRSWSSPKSRVRRCSQSADEHNDGPADPAADAVFRAIQAKSAEDPLIGAKLGAKEICQRLVDGMKTEQGVQVESLLCAVGALAGYACQADLRSQALEKGMAETAPFHLIGTADGKKYMYGDALNNALAGPQYSVWVVAGGAAQHAGCTALPDVEEMFGYVTEVSGSDKFGIPRVPENQEPNFMPIDCVTALWPALHPIVKRFCPNSSDWPILYSLAIQEIIYMGKDTIDPCLALKIVMESAIAMSKIDRPLGPEPVSGAGSM